MSGPCLLRRVKLVRWAMLVLFALSVAAASPSMLSAGPGEPAGVGAGQDPPIDSAGVVRASLRPASVKTRPGQTVTFAVEFTVQPGWHLYAHGDTTFYGVDLSGLTPGPLAGAKVNYPAGEAAEFFGAPVRLLAGRQTIGVRGVLPDSCRAGSATLPLALEVQACDDKVCLAPARLALPLRLEVAPAADRDRQSGGR